MARRIRSGLVLIAVAGAAVATSSGLTASASSPNTPPLHTYPGALTPAQIAQLSAKPDERVIVLLADQHREVPGSVGSTAARAAVLARDEAPLLSELKAVSATNVHPYAFLAGIAATVSHAEALRLATLPNVGSVVPDRQVAPTPAAAAVPSPSTPSRNAGNSSQPAVIAPAPGVCPTNPAHPLLEPEALQTMNVNFGANSTQPSASQFADGSGVKVAVFPDGLDPNNPDFIRNGHSAIVDYQDFTGEGTAAKTGGAEAFGDASSLISQGNLTFDLSKEVNPAHALPPGCNIQIKGVSPGADLAVMKVFGTTNLAFNSLILNALEYAVTVDHVDILSESFGGNPVPNTGNDPVATFDADATAAGVSVVASSGDAGTTNTIGTPATNSAVISAAASTTARLWAQTGSYGYGEAGSSGWVSNEISALSSSGNTDYGPRTVDVLAPGDLGWSDCSSNTAMYTECTDAYHGPMPQPIEAFGGTSESAPLTAGVAALVIQAYRQTHGGATPSPMLVKQIIKSSAQDVGARANLQGAGLVDGLRAVQTAQSIHDSSGSPAGTGGLLYSQGAISATAAPGLTKPVPFTVTNTGAVSQTVRPSLRVLGPTSTLAAGTLTINSATDPSFIYQSGATVHGEHILRFTVPAGTDDLVSRIAWLTTGANSGSLMRETLFDPAGRIVAQSQPQGAAGGFGEVDVHTPTPGTWTLLVFARYPYNGPMTYSITGSKYTIVANAVVPSTRTIPPGGVGNFTALIKTPSSPGDLAEAIQFTESANAGPPLATIPVTLRSTVPVARSLPGTFTGTLTGGNARMPFYGQGLTYQFAVPPGMPAVNVNISVALPGYQVYAFLDDPNASPVDVQTSYSPNGANLKTIHLTWNAPTPGLWSINLIQVNGVSSGQTSSPVSGVIDFNSSQVTSAGVPTSTASTVAAGVPVHASVTITNNGNSPAAYSLDPRLRATSTIGLPSVFGPPSGVLPIADPTTIPAFAVPPFSTHIDVVAQSGSPSVPIDLTTSPNFGSPEIGAATIDNFAIASYDAPDIPASVWSCGPAEVGPFATTAPASTFQCGADATTNTFDQTVVSDTGDIWSALVGLSSAYAPLILNPGQSGTIGVTFTPSGPSGTNVTGFLAVETFNQNSFSSDQVTTIPYKYRIG
ncbi:MAG: S8 family peptidase [Actinomycetota bacterium]|nr:S8 family peptidase [Actinomycetota bacterium]